MRFKQVVLYTNRLREQRLFYEQTLGFLMTDTAKDHFSFQAGYTKIIFRATKKNTYYHFAFNISSFQSQAALSWLKERVSILKNKENEELINFVNWNAEAVYFKDPSNNIVEFIARKNLNIKNDSSFSLDHIVGLSEMGWPTTSVSSLFVQLNKSLQPHLHKDFPLPKYSGNLENFCAMGDEEGLFILVNKNKKLWYPTDVPARFFPFEAVFEIKEQLFACKNQSLYKI